MTVGAYEVPIWGENDWLVDVTDQAGNDPSYDLDDLFEPVRKGLLRGPGLRPAVLRRVVVPDVPQGPVRRGGHPDARAADLGTGRLVRPQLKTATGPDLPTRQARLGRPVRFADHRGQHLRRAVVRHELGRPAAPRRSSRKRSPSTSTPWPSPGRPTRRPSASPSASTCSAPTGRRCGDATSAAGSVEESSVKGKVGYVRAPVKETTDSGWLWSWNLGISAEATRRTQPGSSSGGPPPRST